MILRWAVSPERKVRGLTTVRAFDSITATRWSACDFQGSAATLRNRSIAPAGSPFSTSKIEATSNWACAAGSEPGNLPIRGSQAAMASSNFFSASKLWPTSNSTCGHPRVERVLGDEGLPGGPGLGVLLAGQGVGGDLELGVEDRPLGVGRLRAVGELGQVALIGGDRLVELRPGPGASGRPGTWRSSTGRPGRASPRRTRPCTPSPLRKALNASMAASALPRARYDAPISKRGPDGLRVRGGVGQEPAEGGDAEVELGVVGRVGDPVGPGDLVERPGPEVGQVLRGGLRRARRRGRGPGRPRSSGRRRPGRRRAGPRPGGTGRRSRSAPRGYSLRYAWKSRIGSIGPAGRGSAAGPPRPGIWPARAIANRSEARSASPLASSRALASRA